MRVVLYSRPGCHLCELARDVLLAEREITPFAFEEIDIDADDDLVRDYGIRIPVVEVDGHERFEYQVDPGELARMVRQG